MNNIVNVFKEKELQKDATVSNFATVHNEDCRVILAKKEIITSKETIQNKIYTVRAMLEEYDEILRCQNGTSCVMHSG